MLNDKGEEVGIIYGWYNTLTDMWYVGQTVNPIIRFNRHINEAINKKDNNYFHRALRKYGLSNWVYCVLEENILRENLNSREIEWIEEFDSFYNGYNLTTGGDTNCIFSEETKEKLKCRQVWNKGKINPYSEETRKRMSESHKGKSSPRKGKYHSKESIEKMSESHKGKSGYWTNKHLSEETRKRISESLKGIVSPNRKRVSQYDLCGNFIKEYACIADAIKENPKCGAISAVCNGYRKQAGGFIWKYAS